MKIKRRTFLFATMLASLLLPLLRTDGAPGDLDPSFRVETDGGNPFGWAAVLQADGKILVGKSDPLFWVPRPAVNPNALVRLSADGTVDRSFKTVTLSSCKAPWEFFDPSIPCGDIEDQTTGLVAAPDIRHIAVQPDGKILIAGRFDKVNGVPRDRIARLEPDGSLDASFDLEIVHTRFEPPAALALQTDGKILVASGWWRDAPASYALRRHKPDGAFDDSFDSFPASLSWENGGLGEFRSLLVQPDGKIITSELSRFNPDGSRDTSFSTRLGLGGLDIVGPVAWGGISSLFGGHVKYPGLTMQPDGKLIIAGTFGSVNGVSRRGIARINANGTLDTSFNPGTGLSLSADFQWNCGVLGLQRNGKILIGGDFDRVNGIPRAGLARLNANGSVDTTFVPDPKIFYRRPRPTFSGHFPVALMSDGKILVAGSDGELLKLYGGEVAPPLSITRSGAELFLSWSKDGGENAMVESAESLSGASPWIREPAVPVLVGNEYLLPVENNAPARFYRLRME